MGQVKGEGGSLPVHPILPKRGKSDTPTPQPRGDGRGGPRGSPTGRGPGEVA